MRVNVISTKHQPSFAQGYTQLSLIATPYEPKKEVNNNAD